MACVDACAHGALESFIARDGHIYPSFDQSRCTDCGLCDQVCPAVSSDSPTGGKESYPVGSWSKDDAVRTNSASGGIFASLAYMFIKDGGYVAGAVMDGLSVRHIITDNTDMIPEMQGSKYQQGDASGIYKAVKKLLTKGMKVLFGGSPCQAAGLVNYLRGNRYDGRLVVVDFICGGFPSLLPLNALKGNCGYEIKRIVSFRDKDTGWKSKGYTYNLKVEDSNGDVHSLGYENIVTKAFTSHLVCRDSCKKCRFSNVNRVSDITIGDFWGCQRWPDEEYKGISLAIIHNQEVVKSLEQAGLYLSPVSWREILPNNARLVYGDFAELNRSPIARHPYFAFKHLSYKSLCSLFNIPGHSTLLSVLHNRLMRGAYQKHLAKRNSVIESTIKQLES